MIKNLDFIRSYTYVSDKFSFNTKCNFLFQINNIKEYKNYLLLEGVTNNLNVCIVHSKKLRKLFESVKYMKFCGLFNDLNYCFMPNIGYLKPGINSQFTKSEIKEMKMYIDTLNDKFLKNILLNLIEGINIQASILKLLACEIAVKREILASSSFDKEKINTDINIPMPFALNHHQELVLKDIKSNFQSDKTTQMLIYGDVGSGKTILAYIACSYVFYNNKSCAIMAPNLALVNQIYNNFTQWNPDLKVVKITAATKEKVYTDNCIFVGTHALLNRSLPTLSLLVIDEQQKFGVMQRSKLLSQNTDLIMLTATPIPRTLSMAMTGILQYCILNKESIKNNIYAVNKQKISVILDNIIEKSYYKKVIWIETTIDEAIQRYEEIKLMQSNVYLVHSGIKDRAAIIAHFIQQTNGIIVGTTVLEVGIDSDINDIVVVNADKLGLSQLHQLNGRVGRRGTPGTSILIGTNIRKLCEIAKSENGFEISKLDLKKRGGSSVLSMHQSGFNKLLFGYKLTKNFQLIEYDYINEMHQIVELSKKYIITSDIRNFICSYLNNIIT